MLAASKGETAMSRLFVVWLCLALCACSTTSTVHQAPPPAATTGQTYTLTFVNQGGDDAEGIAALEGTLRSKLREAGLLGDAGPAMKLEVVLSHYYVRSNGARFWAGIMAGRDKIISRVRMLDRNGRQVGSFDVESTNTTAWGTSGGLMERHADEIVSRLRAEAI
jgi:hypothetical protein